MLYTILLIILETVTIVLLLYLRKRLLTKIIATYRSEYNELIEIKRLGLKELWMIINKSVQGVSLNSPLIHNSYWQEIAKRTIQEIKNKEAPSILHIGLGAGTVPGIIKKEVTNAQQIIIEIDQVVIDAYDKYFKVVNKGPFTILVQDIFAILDNPNQFDQKFDVIIVDIYNGRDDQSYAIFSKLTQWTKKNAIIIFNRPAHTEKLKQEADTLISQFKQNFSEVDKVFIADKIRNENYMLVVRVAP
ncbi:MAG: hypothetical protein M3Q44_02440 [bacterium]|nr:hypothetical protein [bacterium]